MTAGLTLEKQLSHSKINLFARRPADFEEEVPVRTNRQDDSHSELEFAEDNDLDDVELGPKGDSEGEESEDGNEDASFDVADDGDDGEDEEEMQEVRTYQDWMKEFDERIGAFASRTADLQDLVYRPSRERVLSS